MRECIRKKLNVTHVTEHGVLWVILGISQSSDGWLLRRPPPIRVVETPFIKCSSRTSSRPTTSAIPAARRAPSARAEAVGGALHEPQIAASCVAQLLAGSLPSRWRAGWLSRSRCSPASAPTTSSSPSTATTRTTARRWRRSPRSNTAWTGCSTMAAARLRPRARPAGCAAASTGWTRPSISRASTGPPSAT